MDEDRNCLLFRFVAVDAVVQPFIAASFILLELHRAPRKPTRWYLFILGRDGDTVVVGRYVRGHLDFGVVEEVLRRRKVGRRKGLEFLMSRRLAPQINDLGSAYQLELYSCL